MDNIESLYSTTHFSRPVDLNKPTCDSNKGAEDAIGNSNRFFLGRWVYQLFFGAKTTHAISSSGDSNKPALKNRSAVPVSDIKPISPEHSISFISRAGLTNALRRELEKLDDQQYCVARVTNISDNTKQLRPVTLLYKKVPILLFRSVHNYRQPIYADSEAIAITLDPNQFPAQCSYKCDAGSGSLKYSTAQLKQLIAKPQLHIESKLLELSERANQPVYLSTTSGKLKVENHAVCFTKPKRLHFFSSSNPVLRHNESLVAPFEPSDVQSILVPKADFLLSFDQVLINKSAYEKKYGLSNVPITIYDEETGERIHCYESQLLKPEEKEDYFEKIEILRHLFQLSGVNSSHLKDLQNGSTIQALQGASPRFLINFVLNLSFDFFQYNFKHKEQILKLVAEPENKVDLIAICNLLSDGANLNFTVKDSYSHSSFIHHVIDLLLKNTSKNELSKDLIENQQELIYTLLHHPHIKTQFLRKPTELSRIPKHLQQIFFLTMPDYVHQSALDLTFFDWPHLSDYIDENLHLHCAGKVLDNMNDSICTKIINSFVAQCIWPHTFNTVESLYFKKHCLNVLLHWKSLDKLEPEILNSFNINLSFSSSFCHLVKQWSELDEDLTSLMSISDDTSKETKNTILNQAVLQIYRYHLIQWSDYLKSDKLKHFRKDVEQANEKLLKLPDHLKEITLPKFTIGVAGIGPLLERLKQPFAHPLYIPNINDSHQATKVILDRYYRMSGPNRIVDIQNLERPARSIRHGSGHAMRVSTNIRLLMQLLEMYDLANLSQHQQLLLAIAAIYHDAAAEDVRKDRKDIASAEYFRRDMTHNCPAIDRDDINAIAEALEHKEDDIHNKENDAINQQQRLYRRLLRFADRLDIARYLSIPEDFPNFERNSTASEVDARLLDIDPAWLNNKNFRETLVSCIHGLLDLAAISGGATKDQRTAKGYINNYQLNPDASERLNHFFEKTPEPLKALEDLMDDNVRRCIAQRADLTTCTDPEHRQCDQQQELQRGGVFGYTRYIHNRYHDLVQVEIPEMQLWEKLAVTHACELLSPALKSAIDSEVKRLREVGIKRNIGNPSQETLVDPEAQQFLKTHHGLKVVAEEKLREVIPDTANEDKVHHRNETILMLKASGKKV